MENSKLKMKTIKIWGSEFFIRRIEFFQLQDIPKILKKTLKPLLWICEMIFFFLKKSKLKKENIKISGSEFFIHRLSFFGFTIHREFWKKKKKKIQKISKYFSKFLKKNTNYHIVHVYLPRIWLKGKKRK